MIASGVVILVALAPALPFVGPHVIGMGDVVDDLCTESGDAAVTGNTEELEGIE